MEHTSLETSQALWDAEYRGEHTHSWMIPVVNGKDLGPFCGDNENSVAHKRICPAYTFSELFNAMPEVVGHYDLRLELATGMRGQKQSIASYTHHANNNDVLHYKRKEAPVEAIAQLMLWLISEGHIDKEVSHDTE